MVNNLKFISEAKDRAPNRARVQPVDIVQTQIAFSRAGLNALGQGLTGDPHFDQFSMLDDFNSKILGDGGPWASVFAKGGLHGVFMVATNSEYTSVPYGDPMIIYTAHHSSKTLQAATMQRMLSRRSFNRLLQT